MRGHTYSEKAPDYWIPSCTELNYYVVSKAGKPASDQKCYGCKRAIVPASSAKFCEFTGRYFCGGCCTGKKFYIPSHIVHHWDFKKRLVNDASYEFLSVNMYAQPIIDLLKLNSELYMIASGFINVRQVRKEMFFLKDYIGACPRAREARDGDTSAALLEKVPAYYFYMADIYSLKDLVEWESVLKSLRSVRDVWMKHVNGCQVCAGKGSRCMVCKSDKLAHLFMINEVTTCKYCRSYFHRSCLKKATSCPICTKPFK